MTKSSKRVALFVGREWSFPPAFMEEVQRRGSGVIAEYALIGASSMDQPCPYDVIIDRISHEVPYYRSYLKKAVLDGVTVVNNPFMWSADDKFFGATLATKLGVATPRTLALPNKSYIPGIVASESLRNLEFPLDWQAIAESGHALHPQGRPRRRLEGGLRLPLAGRAAPPLRQLRPPDHDAFRNSSSGSGSSAASAWVRSEILPMPYDPRERRYLVDTRYLGAELQARIVQDARTLVRALGYDMNSIEFAVRDGIPYAIDFMNPAPDMDINSLTPTYFEWTVKKMADMAIELAQKPRPQSRALKWDAAFTARR